MPNVQTGVLCEIVLARVIAGASEGCDQWPSEQEKFPTTLPELGESWHFLDKTGRHVQLLICLMAEKDPHAVALGAKGGKKTAKRGPDYFRKIQALRKHRRGGRRPKRKR